MAGQTSSYGIAAEPDSGSRQLQEKAGGVMPAGLFSWAGYRPPELTAL